MQPRVARSATLGIAPRSRANPNGVLSVVAGEWAVIGYKALNMKDCRCVEARDRR